MLTRCFVLRNTGRLNFRLVRRSFHNHTAVKPLRILFCGSDDFSIHSLKALHAEKQSDPSLIESLDVVYRPGKLTGRGLKQVRHVPIEAVAHDLQLTRHAVDSFKGWDAPSHVNMVIAVSFGLLIPRRIIEGARYGGLNVHPSLLPDLRGAAPIHHTLLRSRAYTGVTIQTLHPTKFDHGHILAQTPVDAYPVHESATVESLTSNLGQAGADLLIKTIRDRTFLGPDMNATELTDQQLHDLTGGEGPQLAPKITPEDRRIEWMEQTAEEILRRQRVLGEVWDDTTYTCLLHKAVNLPAPHILPSPADFGVKRLVFDSFERHHDDAEGRNARTSDPLNAVELLDDKLLIGAVDGQILSSDRFTLEGGARGNGVKDLAKAVRKEIKKVQRSRKKPD